jgi:drug/metabolite transporter (DMT)-like permease
MKSHRYIILAILAAVLYALSTPISKLLLDILSPTFLAGLLYLGAGLGMGIVYLFKRKTTKYRSMTKKELPPIIWMILLDILAPILLLIGLTMSHPENVALLNNFEIVATSLFAAFIFKEVIPKRLRLAIILVTIASLILTIEDVSAFKFSIGSLFVILATICWGLENNFTRQLSVHDPVLVVIIKGTFSGIGSIIVATIMGELIWNVWYTLFALLLGFVAYGLSIFFYVSAQKELGAAKTSTFYAFAPFVGAIISLAIFPTMPSINFFVAIFIMGIGTYFASSDKKDKKPLTLNQKD